MVNIYSIILMHRNDLNLIHEHKLSLLIYICGMCTCIYQKHGNKCFHDFERHQEFYQKWFSKSMREHGMLNYDGYQDNHSR
jgi:hypothetical protein